MLVNYDTVMRGERVLLVPYRREHVPMYHEWMKDPHLQETTASEPLTLEEEYAMQETWRDDPGKCTFILLDPGFPDTPGTGTHGGAMAGDVNLFFNDHDDSSIAEIEVMIAEPRSRRRGLAREALMLLMAYAVRELAASRYRAKVGSSNAASLALFRSLGYAALGSPCRYFDQVTLELGQGVGDQEAWRRLRQLGAELSIGVYDSPQN